MDTKAQERLARQAKINASRLVGRHENTDLPQPPYHIHGVRMLYLLCRFDHQEIARLVPPGLTPSGTGWGVIAIYEARQGWGIAPFSAAFMTAELAGVDSSDGSPGNYMHSGVFSGVAGEVMSTAYNANFRIGWSKLTVENGHVLGEAGVGDRTLLRIQADITAAQAVPMSGVSRYIGRRPDVGFNSYSVAFTLDSHPTHNHVVEFLADADDVFRVTRPLEYVWPVYLEPFDMAFTPPRQLGVTDDAVESRTAGLSAIFGRLGRPAAILAANGTVLSLNHDAHDLVAAGKLVVSGSRFIGGRDDTRKLDAVIAAALAEGGDAISKRIAFEGNHNALPYIAQAIGLGGAPGEPGRVLLIFDDPARDYAVDPTPALQLLGLTPAEARVAGLVGAGRSPREAANELALSLNTVRSALKIVFDKLGISRQAELAKIVARLAG
jgi:DNA-binding CsgD family transcriptional regulator